MTLFLYRIKIDFKIQIENFKLISSEVKIRKNNFYQNHREFLSGTDPNIFYILFAPNDSYLIEQKKKMIRMVEQCRVIIKRANFSLCNPMKHFLMLLIFLF